MDAESFWQNVSQVLKTKKISQEKMCEDIGISIWTLRGSISKKIFPRVDIAKNIADYLGTSIDFLLTGTETNQYKQHLDSLKTGILELLKNAN